jgi:hypothetical protein
LQALFVKKLSIDYFLYAITFK